MSTKLKAVLSVILIILFMGSSAGLILTFTSGNGGEVSAEPKLEVKLYPMEEILTCAYKSYGVDEASMYAAKTIIKNVGDVPVKNFRISYKIEGFCEWSSTEVYPVIVPGETVRDYCFPNFFEEKIKELTTKTPAELIMQYEYEGLDEPVVDTEKIFLLGKNDFVFTSLPEEDILTFADAFDNYPMLAAFVTPNEETVKSVANAIASGLATNTSDEDALTAFLRCFQALRELGVSYIQEPESYWSERTAQYVQYPHETLSRKSGTCLDLALCMAALMEAVGIRSYVALIPGHAVPLIELPISGDLYAIESTFVDREFAVSHYPGMVSAEVTPEECLSIAAEAITSAMEEGNYILVDIEAEWEKGMMPIW